MTGHSAPLHRWTVQRFRPQERRIADPVRAWAFGLALRCAAQLGFAIVLVGSARTGKTYLLHRVCPPSRVMNSHARLAQNNYRRAPLDPASWPSGTVALDEAAQIDSSELQMIAPALRARRIVVAVQRPQDLTDNGFAEVLRSRPVLMVTLK